LRQSRDNNEGNNDAYDAWYCSQDQQAFLIGAKGMISSGVPPPQKEKSTQERKEE
jgi:hypothetical protein